MDRKTAAEFPAEVLQLYDGYVHGTVTCPRVPQPGWSWSRPLAFFKQHLKG